MSTRFIDRPLTEADIPAVLAMETDACLHPIHAWTADNYRSSIRAGYWSRVRCDRQGHVVAVVVAMDGAGEVHLLNIAVGRAWHRQGVAHALIEVLVDRCRHLGADSLWLEVRPSNEPALALYLREGFEHVGVRRHYYPAPEGREDALVMKRPVPLQAPGAAPIAQELP